MILLADEEGIILYFWYAWKDYTGFFFNLENVFHLPLACLNYLGKLTTKIRRYYKN